MIDLEKQVQTITLDLDDKGINANVLVRETGTFRKDQYLLVRVDNLTIENQMDVSAALNKSVLKIVGYGLSTSKYDPRSKQLEFEYRPIRQEEPKDAGRYAAAGCDSASR